MKPSVRVMVCILLVFVSACAFGQDLGPYRMLGDLVPHGSAHGGRETSSLLIYKNKGVLFHVASKGGVMEVQVFPPAVAPQASPPPAQTGDVVPGVGAYGVTLGMPHEQIGLSPYLKDARKVSEDLKGAIYDVGDQRLLIVSIHDGKVSQVNAFGGFKTVDGIGDGSAVADVETVYGPPDEYYDIVWRFSPHPNQRAFLIMPLLGLMTGLFLRWARPFMHDTPGGLVWMAVVGAIGLSVAAMTSKVILIHATGIGLPVVPLLRDGSYALVPGAGIVLILEALPRKLGGILGHAAALVLMLIAVLVADQATVLIERSMFITSGLPSFVYKDGPFVLCMFLTAGRPKRV